MNLAKESAPTRGDKTGRRWSNESPSLVSDPSWPKTAEALPADLASPDPSLHRGRKGQIVQKFLLEAAHHKLFSFGDWLSMKAINATSKAPNEVPSATGLSTITSLLTRSDDVRRHCDCCLNSHLDICALDHINPNPSYCKSK